MPSKPDKKNGPYKLKINRLDFLSAVNRPAQGEGGRVALMKMAPDGEHVEVQLTAQVAKTNDELGLVFGYAFAASLDGGDTPHVDVQDDAIDPDFLREVVEWIEKGGATDVNHNELTDGRVVFAWPLLPDINKALGIDAQTVGLAVAVKPSADTYAKFKSGELKGFSIGGFGTREPLAKNTPAVTPAPAVAATQKPALARSQRAVLTTAVMGHTHLVASIADTTSGTTTTDRAYIAGSTGAVESSHAHPWVRNDDGTVTIGEALGHTHALVNVAEPAATPAGAVAPTAKAATDADNIAWLDRIAAQGAGQGAAYEHIAKESAIELATLNANTTWGAAWLEKHAEETRISKEQAETDNIAKAAKTAFAKARTDFETYVAKHAREKGVSFEVASGLLGAAADPTWDDLYMRVDEARDVMKAAPIRAATKAVDDELAKLNEQVQAQVEAFGLQHNLNAMPGGDAHQRLDEISPSFRKLVNQRDAVREQRDVAKRRAEQQQHQAAYKSADVDATVSEAQVSKARRDAMTKSQRSLEEHVSAIAKTRNEPYPVAFTWALAHDDQTRDLYEVVDSERNAPHVQDA